MIETTEDLINAGFQIWGDADPFENLVGPFFHKDNGDGTFRSAFIAEPRHCNAVGMLHGGLLMSFADYSLFAIAKPQLDSPCVTLAMNSEFVAAGRSGELIESTGELVRATRSLMFIRGTVFSADKTILSFSGIIKKVKPKS